MKQHQQVAEILDYIEGLEILLHEEMVEIAKQDGQLPCPHCEVEGFIEANQTRLLSEVFALSKDSPKLMVSVLLKNALLARTSLLLTDKLLGMVQEMNELEAPEQIKEEVKVDEQK